MFKIILRINIFNPISLSLGSSIALGHLQLPISVFLEDQAGQDTQNKTDKKHPPQ